MLAEIIGMAVRESKVNRGRDASPRFSDELNVIKEGENIRSPLHYRQQMDP